MTLTHTHTHTLTCLTVVLLHSCNITTWLCQIGSRSTTCRRCSVDSARAWKWFVLCLVCLKVSSRQSFSLSFLPRGYKLMEKQRKCRLACQMGYKTTFFSLSRSPQVVSIPGLPLCDPCVICCPLVVARSQLRLHKAVMCVSHQSPVAGQMGRVWVCVWWWWRWMAGVMWGEENWVERTAVDCEMRGFPTLLFSLALLFPLFFCGSGVSVTTQVLWQ